MKFNLIKMKYKNKNLYFKKNILKVRRRNIMFLKKFKNYNIKLAEKNYLAFRKAKDLSNLVKKVIKMYI